MAQKTIADGTERAMNVIAKEGRQAVLNVVCNNG